MNALIEQLKRHEGFRSKVYQCTANKRTIGYGYNLDANPLKLSAYELNRFCSKGITEKTAENLLVDQVYKLRFAMEANLPWWSKLNEARQDVLINMAYNLGLNGLLEFKKTMACIEHGDYAKASKEMLHSGWAIQVAGRSKELSEQMKTGRFAE